MSIVSFYKFIYVPFRPILRVNANWNRTAFALKLCLWLGSNQVILKQSNEHVKPTENNQNDWTQINQLARYSISSYTIHKYYDKSVVENLMALSFCQQWKPIDVNANRQHQWICCKYTAKDDPHTQRIVVCTSKSENKQHNTVINAKYDVEIFILAFLDLWVSKTSTILQLIVIAYIGARFHIIKIKHTYCVYSENK